MPEETSSAAATRGAGALTASWLVGPACGMLRSDLDPVRLVVDVENSLLDFVIDFPARDGDVIL
jgi:hypothetical protein